jgi:hypothetical protein
MREVPCLCACLTSFFNIVDYVELPYRGLKKERRRPVQAGGRR